jgi:hypothetical protein
MFHRPSKRMQTILRGGIELPVDFRLWIDQPSDPKSPLTVVYLGLKHTYPRVFRPIKHFCNFEPNSPGGVVIL